MDPAVNVVKAPSPGVKPEVSLSRDSSASTLLCTPKELGSSSILVFYLSARADFVNIDIDLSVTAAVNLGAATKRYDSGLQNLSK